MNVIDCLELIEHQIEDQLSVRVNILERVRLRSDFYCLERIRKKQTDTGVGYSSDWWKHGLITIHDSATLSKVRIENVESYY